MKGHRTKVMKYLRVVCIDEAKWEALELAWKVPVVRLGGIEVRPIMEICV